jgi:two-component system chemotaxis response regulator CheY
MSRTVVIIDDSNFLLRQIVDFFVKQLEFTILATGNDGNDAIELYKKHKPDLLTLDINMPNKDGLDALKEILQDFPDANIMMISAVRGGAMLECISAGAKGFVEKPLKFADSNFINDFKLTVDEALRK